MENVKDTVILTEADIKTIGTDGVLRVKTEGYEIDLKILCTTRFR